MEITILEFGLMIINLYTASLIKLKGGNPAFNYFGAGFCCSIGILELIKLF